MFQTFTWLAMQADRVASPRTPGFRKLRTSRGDYFVDWAPGPVSALIQSERIQAAEVVGDDARDVHRLVRDLFLLGFEAELDGDTAPSASPISQLARDIIEHRRRPG